MKNWKVELTAEGTTFDEVKAPRDIFQGDGIFTNTISNSDDATQSHT